MADDTRPERGIYREDRTPRPETRGEIVDAPGVQLGMVLLLVLIGLLVLWVLWSLISAT